MNQEFRQNAQETFRRDSFFWQEFSAISLSFRQIFYLRFSIL